MVDSSRRRAERRPLMANHNRCWIWGRNAVLETLRAGRWPILELMVGERVPQGLLDEAMRVADRSGVSATIASDQQLAKACRSEEHQGFAARMAPFPCQSVSDLLGQLPRNAAIVLLDRLQDSFNVGAIIRSASTLGIEGVVIGDKEQSEINSQVARSSAGAVNHLPIAQTSDLADAIRQFKDRGFQCVAASEKSNLVINQADFACPTLAIIGNEGRGVHHELMALCDLSVRIPMTGPVGSLNAAVAAGILFYEIHRQRQSLSSAG